MRKIQLAILATCIYTCGCKPAAIRQTGNPADSTGSPVTDTMITDTDTIVAREITSWKRFEDYAGRYAGEVDLLEQEPLKTRFKELLEKDTLAFIQRYQVAPPIEMDEGILYNDGCKPHSCSSDEASLAIDMNRDVLYAGIAVNGAVKLYAEKGDTAIPQRLQDWKQKFSK